MAYKIYFDESRWRMKEIGEKLKEARESMGITLEEAAEDLKLRPSQIQNIEEGNMEAFKDIFYLKYFIRDYSKYLGLDKEDLIDEFNEYLFDYTSKISLDDIKRAKKEHKKAEAKRIKSPYTIERKRNFFIPPFIIIALIVFIIGVILYFIVISKNNDDFVESNIVGTSESKGE